MGGGASKPPGVDFQYIILRLNGGYKWQYNITIIADIFKYVFSREFKMSTFGLGIYTDHCYYWLSLFSSLSPPLFLLLFTHFGETPEDEILFPPIFWHIARRNVREKIGNSYLFTKKVDFRALFLLKKKADFRAFFCPLSISFRTKQLTTLRLLCSKFF